MSKKLKLKVGKTYLNGHGIKITIIDKSEINRYFKYICNKGYSYHKSGHHNLTPSNMDLVSEYTNPVERDLSGVQYILDLLVPEVRERVIELSNDPCGNHSNKSKYLGNLFTWGETDEGWKYWFDIDNAIDDKSLRENNPAFIQPFKWIRDRMPNVLDVDGDGMIACFYPHGGSYVNLCHYTDYFYPILGWAKTEDVKQFTKDNPAPHPLTNQ